MLREYAVRGKTLKEAKEVYESRLIDETPFILDSKKQATTIIDLALSDECV